MDAKSSPQNHCFRFKQFTIWYDQCAMKVGTDGTLLGAWAEVPSERDSPPRILDIGTGTGLIALMMAQRYGHAYLTGIDIDLAAVNQATENAAMSPFAKRIKMLLCDVAKMEGTFDAIVCNPPFFTQSLHSPDARRSLARHNDSMPPRTLMLSTWRLLDDRGELSIVIPVGEQKQMESEATLAGFFKCRECRVITAPTKAPKRVLLAFRKHPTPLQLNHLTIGTEEYRQLMDAFLLDNKDNQKE